MEQEKKREKAANRQTCVSRAVKRYRSVHGIYVNMPESGGISFLAPFIGARSRRFFCPSFYFVTAFIILYDIREVSLFY